MSSGRRIPSGGPMKFRVRASRKPAITSTLVRPLRAMRSIQAPEWLCHKGSSQFPSVYRKPSSHDDRRRACNLVVQAVYDKIPIEIGCQKLTLN
jgi:hypothetical protein